MIRIPAVKWSPEKSGQGTLSNPDHYRDVKEDLKNFFFLSLKNISRCQSFGKRQIYGLPYTSAQISYICPYAIRCILKPKISTMVKPGRASIKRGKPSYFMSILGVTLVLCLLGIIGIITINSRKLITNLKESVEVHVFLKQNIKDTARERLQNYIASQPYVKEVEYTDKETAKKEWLKTGGEDFTEFIDNSLLPASIDFKLKAEFLDSAKLAAVKAELSQFPIVDEVRYPIAVVNKMVSNFRTISIALLIVAILISVMVIILIDNTIRLAMFSNRFLIKTMQMVGATRWFIARPLDVRAIINGSISGVIATAIVYLLMLLAENFFDGFKKLHDTQSLTLLGFVLVLLGIGITLFSTHRSVIKYLRMKLDELY